MPSILRIEAARFPQQLAGRRVVAREMIGAPRDDHILAVDLHDLRRRVRLIRFPLRCRTRGLASKRLRRSRDRRATRYDGPSCITATTARPPAKHRRRAEVPPQRVLAVLVLQIQLPLLLAVDIEAGQRAALVVHDDMLAVGHRRRIAAAADFRMLVLALLAELVPPQLVAVHVVAQRRRPGRRSPQVTKICSPHTAGVDVPAPGSFTFHARPSSAENFTGYSPSAATPVPSGPRHCGQFSSASATWTRLTATSVLMVRRRCMSAPI